MARIGGKFGLAAAHGRPRRKPARPRQRRGAGPDEAEDQDCQDLQGRRGQRGRVPAEVQPRRHDIHDRGGDRQREAEADRQADAARDGDDRGVQRDNDHRCRAGQAVERDCPGPPRDPHLRRRPGSGKTDAQRHDAGDAEECGRALDDAAHAVAGICRGLQLPAALRRQGADRFDSCRSRHLVGQPQPVAIVDQRARLNEARRRQIVQPYDDPRPDHEAPGGQPVRFDQQHAADDEGRVAEDKSIAETCLQARQQRRLYQGRRPSGPGRQRVAEPRAVGQFDHAEERIKVVDGLEFDGQPPAVDSRRRAQLGRARHRAQLAQGTGHLLVQRHIHHRDSDVATEYPGAALRQRPHQPVA